MKSIVKILFATVLILSVKLLSAQEIKLNFALLMGNKTLQINEPDAPSNSIQITKVRFYISNIEFLKNGKTVAKEQNSYHLLDASNKESLTMLIPLTEKIDYDEISFLLGTDSLANVSGIMDGDLDPTKGMYWAWNSGYINFKLEGTSPLCKTRNNEFQFHLGGYLPPYPSYQPIKLGVKKSNSITINVDFDQFFEQVDLSKQNKVMSPGKLAQDLSVEVAQLFSVQ